MVIYSLMKNLISKKFYGTKEEAVEKLGVYYAFNMLSDEQMAELALLAESVYPDKLPEPIPDPEPIPEPEPAPGPTEPVTPEEPETEA